MSNVFMPAVSYPALITYFEKIVSENLAFELAKSNFYCLTGVNSQVSKEARRRRKKIGFLCLETEKFPADWVNRNA